MTFNPNALSPIYLGGAGGQKIWAYVSTDSIATMQGASYFTAPGKGLQAGDMIEAVTVNSVTNPTTATELARFGIETVDSAGVATLIAEAENTVGIAVGAEGSPSISFAGDLTTGFYWISSGVIGFTSGGTLAYTFDPDAFLVPFGDATNPGLAFQGDDDTGIFRSAANTLAFGAGSAIRASIASTGFTLTVPALLPDGAVGTPSLRFTNDPDTGLYLVGTNDFGLVAAGSLKLGISSSGILLGAMVDVNGQALGDGTRELLKFIEDGSAVNEITIENEATGSGPILSATGDDSDIDLWLKAKAAGGVKVLGQFMQIGYGTAGVGQLRLLEDQDNGTNYAGFKAPATLAGNVVWELPAADGPAGARLQTSGAAVMSWVASMPKNYMTGMRVTNNGSDATNDYDISAGAAIDSTNARDIVLAAAITKRLDAAWAVGTGNGGLDTGAVGDSLYYAWAILRSDTGVVDVLFSLSATAPTMPANYDYKRRLRGGFYRSGGVNRPIYWVDESTIHFTTTIEDIDDTDIDAEELVAVTCPPSMIVRGRATLRTQATGMVITSPSEAAGTPSATAVPGLTINTANATHNAPDTIEVLTDSSSQIQATPTTTNLSYHWVTIGFRDNLWRTGA